MNVTSDDEYDTSVAPSKQCIVCHSIEPKYKCPACESRTCSLECCKKHKLFAVCDGAQKMSRYVPMSKFDNLTLLNDYRLLEKAERLRNKCKDESRKRQETFARRDKKQLNRLSQACARWACKIKFLPPIFYRSQTNTSNYDHIADTIFWKIHWIFVDSESFQIETERNPDTVKLVTFLKQILRPKPHSDFVSNVETLASYHNTDLGSLRCFLKVEDNGWTKDKRYYELNVAATLRENLRNKILYEFPVICVCKPDGLIGSFKVLSEDVKNEVMGHRVWERTPMAFTFDEKIKVMQQAAYVSCQPPSAKHAPESEERTSFERDLKVGTDDSVLQPAPTPLKRIIPMRRKRPPENLTREPVKKRHHVDDFKTQKSEMIKRLAEELAGTQNKTCQFRQDFTVPSSNNTCSTNVGKFEESKSEPVPAFFHDEHFAESNKPTSVLDSKPSSIKTAFFGTLGDDDDITDDSDED